jgi:hypothetical protein
VGGPLFLEKNKGYMWSKLLSLEFPVTEFLVESQVHRAFVSGEQFEAICREGFGNRRRFGVRFYTPAAEASRYHRDPRILLV